MSNTFAAVVNGVGSAPDWSVKIAPCERNTALANNHRMIRRIMRGRNHR